MDGKFLGVGIMNAFGLWRLFLLFSLVAKVIAAKYHVDGVSEVVLTAA